MSGPGEMPGGAGLIRRALGRMLGLAASQRSGETVAAQILVRRAYGVQLLAEHLAWQTHPGRVCRDGDPEDRCHRIASGLFFARWRAELSRLHDGLPEPIVAQTGRRSYRVAVPL